MKKVLLFALLTLSLFIATSNGTRNVAHASQDLGVCETWRSDGDWTNWVSFDCHGWYVVGNGSNGVNDIGIGFCSNDWDYGMCQVSNRAYTGGVAVHGCGDYGSISNNSGGDCGLPNGGRFMGVATNASDRQTIDCCPGLVELPNGDLFFFNGTGYVGVPGYWDAVNDGFHSDGNGGWVGFVRAPSLPGPFVGMDLGCNCGPVADTPNPSGPCCPDYVETPAGDIYQYNPYSQGYEYLSTEPWGDVQPDITLNPQAVPYAQLLSAKTNLVWCPNARNPWTGGLGDMCPFIYKNNPPAGITVPKRVRAQDLRCQVEGLRIKLEVNYPVFPNVLEGTGQIHCEGGNPDYRTVYRLCIEKEISTAFVPTACNGTIWPGEFFDPSIGFLVLYECDYTSERSRWTLTMDGEVTDESGNNIDLAPSPVYRIVDPATSPGGCY